MKRVRIVTDSTADLPKELVDKYKITVMPLTVTFNGKESLKDGVDINTEQFYYRIVEKKQFSATSQPSPADFVTAYRELSASGDPVISIHISSALSGTFQSANMAKKMVENADIEIIDSKLASMGLGLIVLEAAKAAIRSAAKEEILQIIYAMLSKIEVFFIVDTLEYLARGGRIGKAQAFLGTILNVKPLLYLKDGMVNPYEKVRGRARAMERLIQIVEDRVGGRAIKCSLVHGMDPVGMQELLDQVKSRFKCGDPVISTLGAVVGTHVGPGVLGIIFVPE